jgi:hypothetical protein
MHVRQVSILAVQVEHAAKIHAEIVESIAERGDECHGGFFADRCAGYIHLLSPQTAAFVEEVGYIQKTDMRSINTCIGGLAAYQ